MKSFRSFGVALIAMLAFGTVAAASASAEITTLLAEWLVNNVAVTTTLPAVGETETLLLGSQTILGNLDILCGGLFDGTIGPDGSDEAVELLNLSGEQISLKGLEGLALECASDTTSLCTNPAKVWALNLPWPTLLVLLVVGTEEFLADLGLMKGETNPGWEFECANGLTDECISLEAVVKVTNLPGGVDGLTEEAFTELAGLELGDCLNGGPKTGVLEGLGEALTTEAGTTLQASSE